MQSETNATRAFFVIVPLFRNGLQERNLDAVPKGDTGNLFPICCGWPAGKCTSWCAAEGFDRLQVWNRIFIQSRVAFFNLCDCEKI